MTGSSNNRSVTDKPRFFSYVVPAEDSAIDGESDSENDEFFDSGPIITTWVASEDDTDVEMDSESDESVDGGPTFSTSTSNGETDVDLDTESIESC